MPRALPPLITEAAALSAAGDIVQRYEMGSTVIGAGPGATVVVVVSGDDPRVSGVQDSTRVLLRGDGNPHLHSRFRSRGHPPVHVFVRLDQGCLYLGTAFCRGGASAPARFTVAELELDRPLTPDMLDAARPIPAPGPVPGVERDG